MTNHKDILSQAICLLQERGLQYGSAEVCFDNIAKIASLLLGAQITPFEVAMIHVSTKLARIQASPTKEDSYMDAINYLAFAAQFSSVFPEEEMAVTEYALPEEAVSITDPSLLDITLEAKVKK